jgi:hypothetical protein
MVIMVIDFALYLSMVIYFALYLILMAIYFALCLQCNKMST